MAVYASESMLLASSAVQQENLWARKAWAPYLSISITIKQAQKAHIPSLVTSQMKTLLCTWPTLSSPKSISPLKRFHFVQDHEHHMWLLQIQTTLKAHAGICGFCFHLTRKIPQTSMTPSASASPYEPSLLEMLALTDWGTHVHEWKNDSPLPKQP